MALLWGGAASAVLAAPAAAQNAGAQVDEIVVTAQRRTERLVDVPASVTVQSGEQLRASGVTSTRELTQVVPGLNFVASGTYQVPSMRGMSTSGSAPGNENTVPIYVDGVYQPGQAGALFDLPDIVQIEALKGPQGTLYGRNAIGGAILITTQAPTEDYQGRVRASYGRYEDFEADMAVSGPIVADKLGFAISGGYRENEGYDFNIVQNKRQGALRSKLIRGKLQYTPVEPVKLTLSGYYAYRDDESTFASTVVGANTAARRTFPNIMVATEANTTSTTFPSFLQTRNKGVSLRGEFATPAGQLTSVTGFTRSDVYIQTDADYTAAQINAHFTINQFDRALVQDMNFVSRRFGPMEFLVGGSLFDHLAGYTPLNVIGATTTYAKVKTDAKAVFGEATFHLTEQLSFTAGGRYSHEKRKLSGSRTGIYPLIDEVTFSEFTPSAKVKYEAPGIGNFYGSYVEAFKSGEFNVNALTRGATRPEKVKAYEIGFKSHQLGDFSFNAAAFYYDYKDIIVTVSQLGVGITTNAAKARSKGFEFNGVWQPIRDLTLSGGFSYLSAKYKDFPNAIANVPRPPSQCPVGAWPCGNVTQTFANFAGNYMPKAPKSSINLAADYRFDVGSAGEGRANVSAYHNGGFFWEAGNRIEQKPYTVVNGRLSFSPASQPDLVVAIWGRNLTDEAYTQGANIVGTADTVNYASPRSYGVSLEYAF